MCTPPAQLSLLFTIGCCELSAEEAHAQAPLARFPVTQARDIVNKRYHRHLGSVISSWLMALDSKTQREILGFIHIYCLHNFPTQYAFWIWTGVVANHTMQINLWQIIPCKFALSLHLLLVRFKRSWTGDPGDISVDYSPMETCPLGVGWYNKVPPGLVNLFDSSVWAIYHFGTSRPCLPV